MCCSHNRSEAIMSVPPAGCACCLQTPSITLLEQIWPDYDGSAPNPYYHSASRAKRIIYRNGFINNHVVSYGEPYRV